MKRLTVNRMKAKKDIQKSAIWGDEIIITDENGEKFKGFATQTSTHFFHLEGFKFNKETQKFDIEITDRLEGIIYFYSIIDVQTARGKR